MIDAGAPGFVDGTPSIRDLVTQLNESRHVVNAALKELEEQGFLLCTAQKGFRINPALRSVPAVQGGGIEVVITENMPWQIDFWCQIIKEFEQLNPQWKVKPYFISAPDQLTEFLRGHGNGPVVIIRHENISESGLPLLPLAEIERHCHGPLRQDDLLPGVQAAGDPYTIPYQLQPAMVFYRREKNMTLPVSNWSWQVFFDWALNNYGAESVAAINSIFLSQTMGLASPVRLDEAVLRDKLERLVDSMTYIRNHNLYNFRILRDPRFQQIQHLITGEIGVTIRNSFYYGAMISGGADRDSFSVFPAPLDDDCRISPPICRLSMAGMSCNEASAEFFRFILEEKTQLAMMRDGLGVSPFRRFERMVVAGADGYPDGLAAVVEQTMQRSDFNLLFMSPSEAEDVEFITHQLTDHIILPVLAGTEKVDREKLIGNYFELLSQYYATQDSGRHLEMLRQQLLANF